jgi:muconate cycloisomerase
MPQHLTISEGTTPASRDLRELATAPLPIKRIDAIPVALPLKKPVKMAGVTIATAENLLVRAEAQDGTIGWGEAASAPTMTGDTLPGMVAAVRDHLAAALLGHDARDSAGTVCRMQQAMYGNTGAKAAIDMALLDMTGRACGLPVYDLLGGAKRSQVRPMCLIGNATLEQDVAEAKARRTQGYTFFKLKVGVKALDDDIATTHAMREALGPNIPLCADANQGFTRESATRYLDAISDANLLFLEQPIAGDDLEGMAGLARLSPTPLGADEGIHSLADITAHARSRAAAGMSLKFIKLGGVAIAIEAAKACEANGLCVNIAGKVAESGIGAAAIVHAGCVVHDAAWGVSVTDIYLAADVVRAPLRLQPDGTIACPTGPGLGIDVDESAIERFRLRST